tara:strand:+ start:105 stop:611 length:507 start_codon:yes stop_codon:yes gene_type:complete
MSNLLVQNIKHTNGTTAQTVDSTGRILTPARPSFFAHRRGQGNQSLSATVNALVQFNQTDHNIGSHFNTSTYKFTCPVSGVYHFDTWLYIYSTDSAEARFYINDTSKIRIASVRAASDVNPHGAGGGVTIQLNANDTVSVYAYANDNAAVYDGTSTEASSTFSGFLVG